MKLLSRIAIAIGLAALLGGSLSPYALARHCNIKADDGCTQKSARQGGSDSGGG